MLHEAFRLYRKTFIAIQLSILAVCAVMFWIVGAPGGAVLRFLGFLEICALVGPIWGVRLRRKIRPDPNTLPLE